MKAAVIEKQGGLENLVYREWPDPEPRAGEVLLKVRGCGLNHLDIFVRRGMPGFPVPMPFISGGDIAGEIAELGEDVTGWKAGDRVALHPVTHEGMMGEEIPGGMAEYVRVSADNLIRIPDNVDFVTAAAVPIAYGTAIRMLFKIGDIKGSDTILILGASGGVGVCCVQLAKIAGAYVIACAGSEEKGRRLKEVGADEVILYTQEDFMQVVRQRHGRPQRAGGGSSANGGVDVVVNFTGGDTWVKSLRTLKLGGRILTCGATAGYDPAEDLRVIWTFELQIRGSNGWEREDIEKLFELVSSGKLRAQIDKTFPLEQAAEALRMLEDRTVVGKVVVMP